MISRDGGQVGQHIGPELAQKQVLNGGWQHYWQQREGLRRVAT